MVPQTALQRRGFASRPELGVVQKREYTRRGVGMEQVGDYRSYQPLRLIPKDPLNRGRQILDAGVWPNDGDDIRGVLHQSSEAPLAVAHVELLRGCHELRPRMSQNRLTCGHRRVPAETRGHKVHHGAHRREANQLIKHCDAKRLRSVTRGEDRETHGKVEKVEEEQDPTNPRQ